MRPIILLLAAVLSGEISAVRILCQQCHVPIADMSRSCHRGRTPLLVAVRQGNVQMVKLLISREKQLSSSPPRSVTVASLNGTSPLCFSAMKGNVRILRLLYSNGGKKDLVAVNNDGHTPMQVAVAGGHTQVVRQLIQWGVPEMDSNLAILSLFSCAATINKH